MLTRQDLRARYVKLHRNVYAPVGLQLTAVDRAKAAWLWSGREAVLVGASAAAILGTRWLPRDAPAELSLSVCRSPSGILIRRDLIADDELHTVGGIRCTSATRTAYDIGRRQPGEEGIIRVDALLNATGVAVSAVESIVSRHAGARGLRQLRQTLSLADGGAESPQETRLRLLLVRNGLSRPVTQIPVRNDRGRVVRRIDMGWIDCMVGVEYDGEQHFTNPEDYANDIDRLEFLAAKGWLIVRVSARQLRYQQAAIVERVRQARQRRGQ